MKKTLFFIMLLWSIVTFSQIPSYYNNVNLTLSGSALKTELSNKIIVTHVTDLVYTPGVWDALRQTDLDPNNSNNVVLIYGWDNSDSDITNDRTRGKTLQDSGSGATFVWNREHVYSKSLANPVLVTSSAGPGTDAHNLRPADRTRNTSRSNRKFADGSGTASYITPEGNWYPGDEWKGDVARMMMYMYLRYGNQALPTNVGVGTTITADPNMILLFLEWNAEDPVSDLEKQRNPVLETLQGNRNPFIDNPAFATQIWGGPQAEDLFNGSSDTQAPTIPTNLSSSNTTSNSTLLTWTASSDNTAVTGYDVYRNSAYVGTSASTSYTATGLSSSTTYSFYVIAKDAANNQSAASASINVTTSAGSGGTTTDILISEYIEGSSNNKALEIANFTGNPVDLSSYDLRKATNGGGSFGSTYQLSGTLADGDVFVIANSSAVSAVTSVADVTTGSGIVTFNGNDAIGLFKNGTLIDLIGNPNSSSTFAANTTLRRKSSVTSPNSAYTTSEWDSFGTDTFDGLGTHSIDGGTPSDTEAPTAPTSLSASNVTETTLSLSWNASTDNVGVTEYEVFQGGSLIGTSTNTSFSVTGLTVVTSYSFTVQAKDAAGNISGNSNTANATTVDLTAPSAPSSLASSNVTETSVDLSWSAASDNVAVASYDVYQDASFLANTSSTSYSVSGLSASTSYDFYVVAKDTAGNQSSASATETITTNASNPGGGGSELFISEYIEGSSNNKALEIANFTGSAVDLSNYDLRKATNGGGSYGSTYQLSGTLANGAVFVIANSSAVSAVTSVADVTTGSGIVTFNGNDAIALFKNGTLIDEIGNPNSSAVFAQDETLRRKSSVTSPNTTYTTSEWDFFAQDTFDGLGSHSVDGAGPSSTVLIESFFETGWDGWIDGGGDAARYSGSRSYEGSYSIRLRDNSSTASSMTTSTFDLTGYDTIETTFYFYVYSMENGEDFWFRYDDGSGWQTVETWTRGVNMENNNFYSATVTMDASSYNFVNNGRFRFQCDASGNADQIYIDQVSITGISNSGSRSMTASGSRLDLMKSLNTDLAEFSVYPNPVDGNILNVQLNDEEDSKVNYRVVSLLGQVLQSGVLNDTQIQLEKLSKGVYFLEVMIDNEKLVKKFIKK